MRIVDADKIRQELNPNDWGTPDERWRPEREFGELIDSAPTVDPWYYPHKGEYPPMVAELPTSNPVIVFLRSYDDTGKSTKVYGIDRWCEALRKWDKYKSSPIAWMPFPEPPKEE